jgi:dipeptidase D
MLGAEAIDLSMLKGHTMLNIDSEEEGSFLTGCAGGMSVNGTIPVTRMTQSGRKMQITVTGLAGGHSGCEIDKEHGNADILMGRVLKGIFDRTPFGILTLAGGLKDNAIPRECVAVILLPEENINVVTEVVDKMKHAFSKEFYTSDPDVTVVCEDCGNATEEILDYGSVNKVVYYLRSVPNGVLHMSQDMPGLVETSLNLGIMELKQDALTLVTSIRSSVSTRKSDLCDRVITMVEMLGGEAAVEGEYPAWEYNAKSTLRPQIAQVYQKLYGKEPEFTLIHAGLECGLLSEKIQDLDCVSFGPNIYDIHTPKERLSIESTGRVWDFLVEFLKQAK